MPGWPYGGARPAPSANYSRIPPLRWLARQVGLLDVLGEPEHFTNTNNSSRRGYEDADLVDRLGRIGGETWDGLSEHFSGDYGPSGESLRPFVNSASPFLNYVNRTLLKGGGSLLDLAGRAVTAPFTAVGAGGGQIIREIEDNPRSASANAFRRDLNLLSQIAPLVAGQGSLPRFPRSVVPIPQRPMGSAPRADLGGLLRAFDEPPAPPPRALPSPLRVDGLQYHSKAPDRQGIARVSRSETEPALHAPWEARTSAYMLPNRSYTRDPMTSEEFHTLSRVGLTDPNRIRTTQDKISTVFRRERSGTPARPLIDTIVELKAGKTDPREIPPVRLFEMYGKVYTLDHRRLVSAREAGVPVRYRKARAREVKKELEWKLKTTDDGMSIRIGKHR